MDKIRRETHVGANHNQSYGVFPVAKLALGAVKAWGSSIQVVVAQRHPRRK